MIAESRELLNGLKRYFDRSTALRWARYVLVGALTAAAYFGISLLLVDITGLSVGFAGPVSYVITHPLAFLSHSRFTYKTSPTWFKYGKYWIGSIFTFCVTAFFSFLGQTLFWGISATALVVILVTPLTQIAANELLTFRIRK
jgi:putative flippase GtrA